MDRESQVIKKKSMPLGGYNRVTGQNVDVLEVTRQTGVRKQDFVRSTVFQQLKVRMNNRVQSTEEMGYT